MSSNRYPDRPCLAVGAVVIRNSCVLLVKRGNPPAQGEWAIPGGNVKLGETLQQAAEREILEETGVTIQAGEMIHSFESIHRDASGNIVFHYVILDFASDYISGEPLPRDDAVEARWISPEEANSLHINSSTRTLLNKIGFLA